jgi:hypothetical protein
MHITDALIKTGIQALETPFVFIGIHADMIPGEIIASSPNYSRVSGSDLVRTRSFNWAS